MSPTTRPVSLPSTISSSLAAHEVEPSSSASPSMTWREPARDHAAAEPEPLERADRGAGARGELDRAATSSSDRRRQARQHRDAPAQRLGEVQLAAHGRLGDLAHLGLAPGVRGPEHLDDLALDQGRVHVEHDEPLARRASPARSTAMSTPASSGDVHQLRAQRAGRVRLAGRRDQQLQPGHRVVGDAADRVDVGAQRGQRPRDRPERPRGDRAAQHDHDVGRVRRGAAGRPDPRTDVVHLHADARHRLLDGLLQALRVVVGARRAPRASAARG